MFTIEYGTMKYQKCPDKIQGLKILYAGLQKGQNWGIRYPGNYDDFNSD